MGATENLDRFTYTLPRELADRLGAVAEREDRSRSGMLRQLLAHALPHFESPGGIHSAPPVTAAPPGNFLELCRGTGAAFHPAGAVNESGVDRGGDVVAPVFHSDAAVPHAAAGAPRSGSVTGAVERGASPVSEQMALHASYLQRQMDMKMRQEQEHQLAKEAILRKLEE
jgi:hypothetical protein